MHCTLHLRTTNKKFKNLIFHFIRVHVLKYIFVFVHTHMKKLLNNYFIDTMTTPRRQTNTENLTNQIAYFKSSLAPSINLDSLIFTSHTSLNIILVKYLLMNYYFLNSPTTILLFHKYLYVTAIILLHYTFSRKLKGIGPCCHALYQYRGIIVTLIYVHRTKSRENCGVCDNNNDII